MAVRDTIQIGDSRLKASNKTVSDVNDPKVKQVVQDLIDTMVKNDLIGMAAPQIGENFRIFITNPRKTQYRADGLSDELRVYINPEIIFESAEKAVVYEGCGSVNSAGKFGPVERPKIVTVVATDQHGMKFQIKADGLLGRVIQHEFDHLNGIEFLDKVPDKSKTVSREVYIRDFKEAPDRIQNSKITIVEYKKL